MLDSLCPGHMQPHTPLCIVHHPDGLFLSFIKSVLIIFIHISLDSLVTKIYKFWLYSVTLVQTSSWLVILKPVCTLEGGSWGVQLC